MGMNRPPIPGGPGGRPRNTSGGRSNLDNSAVRDALQNVRQLLDKDQDPHGELLIQTAEAMGRHLANNRMTTAQIRKLFSEVRKLNFKDDGPYKTNMMRAKLAYTAGRHREVGDLQQVLDKALIEVGTSEEKFNRFENFFEAIVAYHKKYGGKD